MTVKFVLALNFVLAVLFYATARHPLPLLGGIILCVFVLILTGLIALAARKRRMADFGTLVVALLATDIIWIPAYLSAYTYTGPLADFVAVAVTGSLYAGFGLLLLAILLSARRHH